ncbi:MAG: cytochrome c oxidase subunit 3 [Chitinophagales bacterium]|nr:cytochrome c oxidase subunit 3 [Chitinophagales bacterium]
MIKYKGMVYPISEKYSQQKAHRFTMYLGLMSITMAFAGLTSAYLVRKGAGNWVDFPMPVEFYTSTIILLISSATIHVAHVSNKKGHPKMATLGLFVTIILGLLFAFFQFKGWQALNYSGIYIDGNPAGSFFYVITGMHAAHLLGGVVFLWIALFRSYRLFFIKNENTTIVNKKGNALKVRTDLLSMYWHFMDILWVYIFLFLFFNLNH